MIDSFNDPILDMAVENQLRWNYNTLFRDCRIEPMIDKFRVDGLNIEFDYVYLNAEKSRLLNLGREIEIEFHCTKYESTEINELSEALLDRYKDLANSLNFDSGVKSLEGESSGYLGDRLGSGKSDKTLWEYYLLESLRHIGVDKDFWDPDTILYQDVFAASTKERIRPTYLSYAEDEDWLCNTWAYKLEEATNDWFHRLLQSRVLPRLSDWRITIRDMIHDLEPTGEDPEWRGMTGIFEQTRDLLCTMFNTDLKIFYDILEKVFPSPYDFMTIKESEVHSYLTTYMNNNSLVEYVGEKFKDRIRIDKLPSAIVAYMELYRPLYTDLYVYIQHRLKTRTLRNQVDLQRDIYRMIENLLEDPSNQILSFYIDSSKSDGATVNGTLSEDNIKRIHELITSNDPAFLDSGTYLDDAKSIIIYQREDKNHE